MKTLFKIIAGSHLYGLNTPESDIDYREVFCNTDPAYILGTKRFDDQTIQNESEDTVRREIRQFFCLLKKQNTECLEMLFGGEGEANSSIFREIQSVRSNFLDSNRLFSCLRGYVQGERRLVMGERTGVLGSKRKMALEKYGYSPKNAANALRLLHTGISFFKDAIYPVNMRKDIGGSFYELLREVREYPENFTKEKVGNLIDGKEREMVKAYENRLATLHFNEDLANDFLKDIYLTYLQ